MIRHDFTEIYPKWLPDAASRDKVFRDLSFHQGKLLGYLRKLQTPMNPEGLDHPNLMAARFDALGLDLAWDRWREVEAQPVLDRFVELDEWLDIAAALGWDVVDVLRWLCVASEFGQQLTIGGCIKEARLAAGLTQQQLGDKIGEGFDQRAIHRLEKVRKRTEVGNLKLVANALGISVLRLVPAGHRAALQNLCNAKIEARNPNNLFERRKRCRAENPDVEWRSLTLDVLDALGY